MSDKNIDFGAKNGLFLFRSVLPFKTRTEAERTERKVYSNKCSYIELLLNIDQTLNTYTNWMYLILSRC